MKKLLQVASIVLWLGATLLFTVLVYGTNTACPDTVIYVKCNK